MPFLNVPGATLHYEIQGQGPLFLLIHGGAQSGIHFKALTSLPENKYKLVTYDRRGHSQSPLTGVQDFAHRVERDADDAAELLKHLGDGTPAYVLGNSSGAIVAYSLLHRHPDLIRKIVLHEPPLHCALSENERKTTEDDIRKVYDLYREGGPYLAMPVFMKYYMSAEEISQMLQRDAQKTEVNPYDWGNRQYWFERELPTSPLIEVDWEFLKRKEIREKLIVGVSISGKKQLLGRIGDGIVERVGGDTVIFPGGHDGFKTHAEEFAVVLQKCLAE
jgi:pimeloyl-ACP methyl ester carboxylesterase